MSQHEIVSPRQLLDSEGKITEEGWARKPYWKYERSRIAAPPWRIKEWDYYAIFSGDNQSWLCLTISDLGYLGMAALAWVDIASGKAYQDSELSFFPMGKYEFPSSSDRGDVRHRGSKLELSFSVSGSERLLEARAPSFPAPGGARGLEVRIELGEIPGSDTMNIATSWKENRKAFYYNTKRNCLPASGWARLGEREYSFAPSEASACLDWGRGVWTYKNRWYWGSASGFLDGVPFGWNIGYGFSDRSPASENLVFYDGRAHKLDDVVFHLNPDDYLAPWSFTSSDGRFELEFKPVVDRASTTNLVFLKSIQHQVFGRFSGRVVLDGGKALDIVDFPGFAEDVLNWW
ncbi:MAG TPA: DUF2804 domain-containing protein [Rectinemataceae bacterium]